MGWQYMLESIAFRYVTRPMNPKYWYTVMLLKAVAKNEAAKPVTTIAYKSHYIKR